MRDDTLRCLYCGGDPWEPDHESRCDGRQGGREEVFNPREAFRAPPAVGLTPETWAASYQAAEQIEPSADTLRAQVLEYIRACGAGATDDEVQSGLALDGNTERPRRWELYNAGLIYSEGHRVNPRGRKCAVWFAVKQGAKGHDCR